MDDCRVRLSTLISHNLPSNPCNDQDPTLGPLLQDSIQPRCATHLGCRNCTRNGKRKWGIKSQVLYKGDILGLLSRYMYIFKKKCLFIYLIN